MATREYLLGIEIDLRTDAEAFLGHRSSPSSGSVPRRGRGIVPVKELLLPKIHQGLLHLFRRHAVPKAVLVVAVVRP